MPMEYYFIIYVVSAFLQNFCIFPAKFSVLLPVCVALLRFLAKKTKKIFSKIYQNFIARLNRSLVKISFLREGHYSISFAFPMPFKWMALESKIY